MQVIHDFALSIEDTYKFMGSKYVQSDLRGIFPKVKSLLKEGKTVLFTGTPCQVAGLKLFLGKPYDKLITVDLLCHGVPSPKIFSDYVDYANRKFKAHVQAIEMRSKQNYIYKKSGYSYCFVLDNGKKVINPTNVEKWGRLYFSGLISRPACHMCPFTSYYRSGDISIGDFWDFKRLRPDVYSALGTSVCLINSEKGLTILNDIQPDVQLWELSKDETEQQCLTHPTEVNPKRTIFWHDYYGHSFDYVYRKYFTDSYFVRFKHIIKKFLILLGITGCLNKHN